MITFVLGGARSGKSRYAESLGDTWRAEQKGERLYVATAQIFDDEMQDRVAKHKVQRGEDWRTIEEPMALSATIANDAVAGSFMLVDCLTLWLTNQLLAEADVDQAIDILCETLKAVKGDVVLVSNEVGLGIVPDNKLARQFRDIAGLANQRVAAVADRVVFVAAGLPLIMKG